jgi:hypothetical protein
LDVDTADADVPDIQSKLVGASMDPDYATDEGLMLAENDGIWVADQFASDEDKGVYFYAWIYTEEAAEENDTVTLINDQEVTVWSWGVVAAETSDNLDSSVELTGATDFDGASTLGLAFASALIAANMF